MATSEEDKHWITVKHPDYGILSGYVDTAMKQKMESGDNEALDQFILAVTSARDEADEESEETTLLDRQEAIWTNKNIKALLSIYIENKNRKMPWAKFGETVKKNISEDVAMDSSKFGDKCRLKIRGLQEKYKRAVVRLYRSGGEGFSIPDELEEAFGDEKHVGNVKMLNSSTYKKEKDNTPVQDKDESDDTDGDQTPAKKSKSNIDRMLLYLDKESKRKEELMMKQHEEKMFVFKSMVDILAAKKCVYIHIYA
ncbi:hypothetical protein ACJMK2_013524 [Sinanodonta woodiana]|uniref:Uncharacterized protein n=1 Tax=Sinanodonta woodiana TaxID=1069815 RepID=A0ABD3UYP4_SINWO